MKIRNVSLEYDLKRMVGEFMDTADTLESVLLLARDGDDKDRAFSEEALAFAHEWLEKMMIDAHERGVSIYGLSVLACSLVANVSNLMFQFESMMVSELEGDDE